MKTRRQVSRAFIYYAALVVAYLILSVVLPYNHANQLAYHLSNIEYHVLLLFILFPLAIIWFVAFYGYSTIKAYSDVIKNSPEGVPMDHISNALMWLAWGLPVVSLVQLVLSAIASRHPSFNSAATIIGNYVNIIFPLVAFHIMSTGTRLWTEKNKLRVSIGATKLLVLLFVTVGSLYTFLVFHNAHTKDDPYQLPHWLLITTVVIPYLYAWFMGFLAAYEISMVSKKVHGLLYQQALRNVSWGLVVIVGSSIILQYFRSAIVPRTGSVSLSYILITVYVLLTIIALGYILLAYGARKLKKIEEV